MAERVTETVTKREYSEPENQDNQWSGVVEEVEEPISSADALIQEVRGDEEATVNIYRVGSGRGKEAFLYSSSPDDLTAGDIMEKCRDVYGGGDFKMVIRDSQKIVKSARFSVEAAGKPEASPEPQNNNHDMVAVMQAMMANQAAMFQGIISGFTEAMRGNQQPSFNPTEATRTIMESVAAIKQLADPPKENTGAEMVKMLIQGITLAKEIGGGGGGETNLNDLLAKGMDMFPALAEAAKLNAGNNPQAPRRPDGQPLSPQDAEAGKAIEREKRMQFEKIQKAQNVAFLLAQAKANRDPGVYAELILDQVGEEKVLAFIGEPNTLDKLIAINGEVATYRTWFETLRDEILALTAPDEGAQNTTVQGSVIEGEKADAVPDSKNNGNPPNDTGGSGGST